MAKKFNFRLAAVLKVRQAKEDERKRELGEIQARANSILDQIETGRTERENAVGELDNQRKAEITDVTQMRLYQQFIASMDNNISRLNGSLEAMEGQIEAKRRELAEAAKERRTLELLEERDYESWQKEMQKTESAELDEIGSQMHFRKDKRGDQ